MAARHEQLRSFGLRGRWNKAVTTGAVLALGVATLVGAERAPRARGRLLPMISGAPLPLIDGGVESKGELAARPVRPFRPVVPLISDAGVSLYVPDRWSELPLREPAVAVDSALRGHGDKEMLLSEQSAAGEHRPPALELLVLNDVPDGFTYAEAVSATRFSKSYPGGPQEGDVIVAGNLGNCCYEPMPWNMEGHDAIGAQVFPMIGAPYWVVYHWVNYDPDAGRLDTALDDHEIGQPAGFIVQEDGMFEMIYSRTAWSSWGRGNRLRGGSVYFSDPERGLPDSSPAHHRRDTIAPLEAGFLERGRGKGLGTVWHPSHFKVGSDEYLMYREDVRAADGMPLRKSDNILLERADDGQWQLVYPAPSPDGLVEMEFVGDSSAQGPNVTDVGVGSDGCLYALVDAIGLGWYPANPVIVEYVSRPGGGGIGRRWEKTGREFSVAGRSIFEGAYLKDEVGRIVEPQVVFANTGNGGFPFARGAWRVAMFAQGTAHLPTALVDGTPLREPAPWPTGTDAGPRAQPTPAAREFEVSFVASGTPALSGDGSGEIEYPYLELIVDGVTVGGVFVSGANAVYTFTTQPLQPDKEHSVLVSFTNDGAFSSDSGWADRNAFVELLRFNGTVIPAATPMVTLDVAPIFAGRNLKEWPGRPALWWNGALEFPIRPHLTF